MPKLEDVFGFTRRCSGHRHRVSDAHGRIAKMRMVTPGSAKIKSPSSIFVVAVVITLTGDPMTQTIFAAPVRSGLSIVVAWLVAPKRIKDEHSRTITPYCLTRSTSVVNYPAAFTREVHPDDDYASLLGVGWLPRW
jgi:hypothetical protein